MNRGQNSSIVAECRPPGWKCVETYRETLPPSSGWSSLYSPALHNSSNPDKFLIRAMLRDGENGFFQQIALVSRTSGGASAAVKTVSFPLIQGHTEVREILSWDEEQSTV